jgi:hypothetical protein
MKQTPNSLFTLFICLIMLGAETFAQGDATVLVVTNLDTKVMVDGIEQGQTKAGSALRLNTTPGEHYIEAQASINGATQNKGEVIQVEAGKQKIIKIEFETTQASNTPEIIPVAEVNFNLPGSVEVIAWLDENPNQNYPYPEFFYAFEKGDEIVINVTMTNKNGTNLIEIATYPAGVVKYTNRGFTELRDLKIKVEERSIYRFTLATNHAFARNALVKVSRKPASAETSVFNANVSRQKIYKPVPIAEPTLLTINSGSNATLKGGKSRILFPVTLPPNTIEWYYRFSASRNPELVKDVQKNFQLFGELTKAFLKLSGSGILTGSMVDVAINSLAMPPGSDYCDVYLLDYNNISNFEAKNDNAWVYYLEGTRKNLMSGNIKVNCCNAGQYYLGIKNSDSSNGINVSVEVIAMTVIEDYVMEQK